MSQIFVFTAGDPKARDHLADSIDKPIDPSLALEMIGEDKRNQLQSVLDREGGLWAWGAVPGDRNRLWWNQMSMDDWVLGVYQNSYHYAARVTLKLEHDALARRVWGETEGGETWSLMYFLSRPTRINVPVESVATHLNSGYRGFTRIGHEKIARIEAEHNSVDQFIKTVLLGSFSEVPDGITKEDVLGAIVAIDRGEGGAFGESTKYDLVYEGRRYPPKQVIGLAAKRVLGRPLRPSEFSGGEESKCFRVLRELGFRIELKPEDEARDERYFLIRSNEESAYADELGIRYHFTNTVPNWRALEHGGKVVVDRKAAGGPVLVGYGTLEQGQARDEGGKTHLVSPFRDWTAIEPPRSFAPEERTAIQSTPGYNVQHAIRPINRQIYEMLIRLRDLPLPVNKDLRRATDQFAAALLEAGVRFGLHHDSLVRAFLASLATKGLVILTGLSGSGKTQIAIKLGEWLGSERLLVAAVRPDWTGAEALFGYEDALKPVENGLPAWSVPEPLAFLLRAAADRAEPYVLVLDEMNLAHVERYFADALSGMESRMPCIPNLVRDGDGFWRSQPGGPERVAFPDNLFVVGTVNVDETTYMFSPKVLDRANTFEFRVQSADLSTEYRKPISCTPGDPALVRGFLEIARDREWHLQHPYSEAGALSAHLRRLHELLSPHGFEFGHRVFYEATRFAALHEQAGSGSVESILDRIVMQKILPRLHGSRRRLEPVLLAVGYYSFHLPDELPEPSDLARFKLEECGPPNAKLPLAFDKLNRMLRSIRANQFASFTE